MLTHVRQFVLFLIWHQPGEVVAGVAVLSVVGVIAGDGTKMYISRGLGFEGGGMPRARFLCRPEIVSIELSGD
ncbi:MAG: hypothetical protein KAW49_00395 [Anaerolineae bacterium]|nr:hypothetical protein [Anaerolineae bacterium]